MGLCGSLRGASTNGAMLRYLSTLSNEHFQLDIHHIGFLPLFNEDYEREKSRLAFYVGIPTVVDDFREVVKQADALIFATPEYNGALPGVLKNAYDWVSRDYSKNGGTTPPIAGKKIGQGVLIQALSALLI